jgi:hypothetical protein
VAQSIGASMDQDPMEIQRRQRQSVNNVARLSPFEQLPNEILREIVKMYFDDHVPRITTIMHICRRLRQATLSLPAIWCSIRVLTPFDSFGAKYGYEDVCSIFL